MTHVAFVCAVKIQSFSQFPVEPIFIQLCLLLNSLGANLLFLLLFHSLQVFHTSINW